MILLPHRAKRFECAAPVAFWWPLANGVVQSGMGVTRNIGNSGVLIATTECPCPGTPVQLTVFLPRPEGIGYAMKLSGEGIVVRIESERRDLDLQATGFAASVQFYPEPMDSSEQPSKGGAGAANDSVIFRAIQGTRRNCL